MSASAATLTVAHGLPVTSRTLATSLPRHQLEQATISHVDASRIEGKLDKMTDTLGALSVSVATIGTNQKSAATLASMAKAEIDDQETRLRALENGFSALKQRVVLIGAIGATLMSALVSWLARHVD